jgi:Lon protease-like protein
MVVHAQVRRNQTRAVAITSPTGRVCARIAGLDSVAVELVKDFPLFPLGLVALPSELIPLHIFEERYKAMMARCLEEESEFGIVWLADDGLRPIGCACEVAEVLERMPDGRLNLVARGTRVFRIEARQEELAYPAGTVEFLTDRPEDVDGEASDAAHSAYADLVEQATDRIPDPDEIAGMTAYEMAATVEFGLDAKQGLLDLRSESARLKLVTRLFRAAMRRLDFIDRAQARARSNGKVHFSG